MENSENNNLLSVKKPKIKPKKNKFRLLKTEAKLENEAGKKRYYIFDNIKGILIFAVVFSHFLWEYSKLRIYTISRQIVIYLYYFHIPGFVFISGFLTSENSSKISNAFKLLILYYIFNFSFNTIVHIYFNEPIDIICPKSSYWYLLSLFIWRISIKYINKLKYALTISLIISLLEGYFSFFTNAFSIKRTVAYFPFFIAGYKIAKTEIFDEFIIWRTELFNFICFFIASIFFLYRFKIYIDKNLNKIVNEVLIMSEYDENNTIKERFFYFIFAFLIIFFFIIIFPNYKIPLINKWGKNSLCIFLFYSIFVEFADKYLFNQQKYSNSIIEYSLLFTIIILFIFGFDIVNKFFNLFVNSIYKNLLEFRIKGKIIYFLFLLSFIILLIYRFNI